MTWGAPTRGGVPAPVAAPGAGSNRTRRPAFRRWTQITVMVVGFGLCALVLGTTAGLDSGVGATLLGLLLAALPVGVVVPAFLWLDRFEAEPTGLLVFAFAWGALVASVGALILNTSSMIALKNAGQDPLTVGAVAVAPFVEETLKAGAVVLIWRLRRREFDGIVDGMVYAGISAAGFAFAENIVYLARAYHETGGAGLAAVFFLRGVMGPFAHPVFTICTGIGLGVAATTRRRGIRVLAPVLGWLAAVSLHAIWNLSTVAGVRGFLAVYVFLQVPVFAGFLCMAVWARRREGRLIGQHLSAYADAGWLSYPEVGMLASMPDRRRARMWARATGGRRALAAMTAFQDTASELALLRMRMERGAADAQAPVTERQLLGSLMARRQEFIGSRVF